MPFRWTSQNMSESSKSVLQSGSVCIKTVFVIPHRTVWWFDLVRCRAAPTLLLHAFDFSTPDNRGAIVDLCLRWNTPFVLFLLHRTIAEFHRLSWTPWSRSQGPVGCAVGSMSCNLRIGARPKIEMHEIAWTEQIYVLCAVRWHFPSLKAAQLVHESCSRCSTVTWNLRVSPTKASEHASSSHIVQIIYIYG